VPNRQAATPSETVWVLSAVGGVLGALVAVEPTGHAVIDRLLCAALVAFTVWAGSTARTWLLIAVSGTVGVLALTEPVVGGVALATAVLLGVADAVLGRQRSIKAVASGVTALVVLHLPEIVRFGGSAVVAAAAIVAISVSGIHMKRRSVRRRVYWGVGAVTALAIVGTVGVGATVAEAQDAVDAGEDEIRSAIAAVNEGDLDAARTDIAAAETSLSEADRALSRPWGRLGAVIPIVAQHRSLAVDLATGQKTGTYLDLRGLRREVAAAPLAGARVLNLFAYSGMLGRAAEIAGAGAIVQVDASERALAFAAAHHAPVPGQEPAKHTFVVADVFSWLPAFTAEPFDLVIVDPPAMTSKATQIPSVLAGYRKLYRAAARQVRAGGALIAACCTSRIERSVFHQTVREALGGGFTLHHEIPPEPDHPVGFAQADYLKIAWWVRSA
jgi:SAM-dependent methyltransferase